MIAIDIDINEELDFQSQGFGFEPESIWWAVKAQSES